MSKMVISEKQVVKIGTFMENYIGCCYDGSDKLTHHVMDLFLTEKKIYLKRAILPRVKKEDLLLGKYIAVQDKNHHTLIYYNPNNLSTLLEELRTERNLNQVKKTRREILKELGYVEGIHGVISKCDLMEEEYPFEHPNRHKTKRKQYAYRNL